MVRRLEDILATQARAEADDRDLASRTDARRARKRAEAASARLAEALVGLSARQLERLQLPEPVLEAVVAARRIESPVARMRAVRAVRRELRSEALGPIEAALRRQFEPKPRLGVTEGWLDRLTSGGEMAMQDFCRQHPRADRHRLRTLLRNLERARDGERARALSALGQALREAIERGDAVAD